MRNVIFGNPGLDTAWIELDLDSGKVIYHPGNRGGGPSSFDNAKGALAILKSALAIEDSPLREAAIRASREYLEKSNRFGDSGVVVFLGDDGPINPPHHPPPPGP